jgi:dTMP kinase
VDSEQTTRRGIFIVIEGIDGTGKSTQANLLRDAFLRAGRDVVVSREPTDGEYGRQLRESASRGRHSPEQELDLFVKDRTQHVENLIKPALAEGKVVILDRYFYSTLAYQGARGVDIPSLRADMERRFPIPDAVFVLDMDPAVSRKRIAQSRGEHPNEFESPEGLLRARAIFQSLTDPYVTHIDATGSKPEVHAVIVNALRKSGRL